MAGESDLEGRCWRRAVARGWRTVKLMRMSEKSWPDRIFLKRPGRIKWVEFKDDGEEPNEQQKLRHRELRALGFEVYVIDNDKDFDRALEL